MKSESWKQEGKWTNLEKELCKSNVMSSSQVLPWGLCLIYYALGNLQLKEAKSIKTLLGFWFKKNFLWYPMGIQRVPSEYHRKKHCAGNLENRLPANIWFSKMPHKALQHYKNTRKNKIWGLYRPLAPFFFKVFKILLWIRDPGVGFRDLQVHVKLVKHLVWAPSPKLNTSELVQKHDFTEIINIHIHNFTPHRPNFTQNLKPTENRERERHTKIWFQWFSSSKQLQSSIDRYSVMCRMMRE